MTLGCGLAFHLCENNIGAHMFRAIINSEGHGQILTQFLEKLHDADKE
jgi:hypothetical protein